MDLCGLCAPAKVRAITWWALEHWDLDRFLCGHHSDDRADAMIQAGWALMEDTRLDEPVPA